MPEQTIIFLRSLILFFQMAAALTGLLLINKWKTTAMKLFIFYLLIITVCEIAGYYLGQKEMYIAKGYLYKYGVLPFEFFFFSFFFFQILSSKKSRTMIAAFVILFSISWIFETIFLDNQNLPFSSLSYSVGNVFLLVYLFNYFNQLTDSEKILSFYKEPLFWVSVGLLVFYLVSFPYYLIFNTIAKNYYRSIYLPYHLIVIFLNYLMYSIFTFAIICTKPK